MPFPNADEIARAMVDGVGRGDDPQRWTDWIVAGCPDADEWLGRPPAPAGETEAALPPGEKLAVTKREAGVLLSKSEDWIETHVLPFVKTIRRSRSVLIPVAELQRWVHENSGKTL